MKDCESIEPLWIDYLDGGLAVGDVARVEEHLASCPRCAVELRAHARIRAAYADVEEQEPEEAVLRAVLERARTAVRPRSSPSATWRVLWIGLAAAAALILGLVLLPPWLEPKVSLERAQALAEEARRHQMGADYEGAADLLAEALELHPGGPSVVELHHSLGISYLRAGQPERALESLALVLQNFPDYARREQALLQTGVALETLGRIREAIATYQLIAQEYPSSTSIAAERMHALQLPEELGEELRSTGYVGD